MVRLNYTNVSQAHPVLEGFINAKKQRKIDGVKLGQVVAKDLTKRIPPSSGSKAALRDPVVEIDLTSKKLGDDGFLAMAEGVAKALQYKGEQGKIVLLEEVCLKDNGLSVSSLQLLTPIINLVCHDLRDLDISNNKISIKTSDDVILWEAFLHSFSQCCVLRRLDLSGNDLGTKAFEVLAKVYVKETPVDLVLPEELEYLNEQHNRAAERTSRDTDTFVQMARTVNITSERAEFHSAEDTKSAPAGKAKSPKLVSKTPEKSGQASAHVDKFVLYATAKGLHSIPYIVLSDTSMGDTSALYLSYVVASHFAPDRLLARVPLAKAGPQQQQLAIYDETKCQGIIYLPNATLGGPGIKVLDLGEKERQVREAAMFSIFSNGSMDSLRELGKSFETSRHASGSTRVTSVIAAGTHRRQASGSASVDLSASGAPVNAMSDLNRARSRIQGQELERETEYGNDLWRVAFKLLCLGRQFQPLVGKNPAQANEYSSEAVMSHFKAKNLSLAKEFPPLPSPTPSKPKAPVVKTLEIPGYQSKPRKPLIPATAPLGSINPNQSILPRSAHGRKASGTVPPIVTIIPPTPLPLTLQAKIDLAVQRAKKKPYSSDLPCGFLIDAWWRILGHAVGAKGILSETQQKSVLRWAMDRNTLRRGREWLGEKEGNQIWHTLDGMGCLDYETDA